MKGEKLTIQKAQDEKPENYMTQEDGTLKPDRDKEVRRLAEFYDGIECEPDDLLTPNDFPSEIDESNREHGFDIMPDEVAELMKFRIFQNATKEKLKDQIHAREKAATKPFPEVPYRDWLAGMIYSSSRGKIGIPNAVKLADKLIKELYPVEGEF